MRKLYVLLLAFSILLLATPAYAQAGAAAPTNWAPLGAAIGIGIAAGLAGIGQGRVAGSVAEALARNPGARPGIQLALFIGLAFIESLVLFAWVMILIKA
ncbi:MAG: ATP synthase F0 subunit C [Acidobacteriales bacterium]|nr:ATP synthase F0 subunit C [Terriglobales bacterium]